MQDPFDPAEGVVDDVQVIERLGVDQPGSGAFAPDLHQEGPLAVTESGRTLCVDSRGSCTGSDGGRASFKAGGSVDNNGYTFAGGIQINHFRNVAVKAVNLDVGGGISNRIAGCGVFQVFR